MNVKNYYSLLSVHLLYTFLRAKGIYWQKISIVAISRLTDRIWPLSYPRSLS